MNGLLSSFRARLLSILVVINVCVLALGTSSYFLLGQVGEKLDEFTGGIYYRLEISNRLRTAAQDRAIAVRNLALIDTPDERAKSLANYQRRQQETTESLTELQRLVSQPDMPAEVQTRVAAITAVEKKYAPAAAAIVELLKNGQREAAIQQIATICNPTLAELNEAIQAYTSLTEERTRAFVTAANASSRSQRQFLLGFVLVSLSVVATLGYLLRRNVENTLGTEPETLRSMLARMADGDLATSTGSANARPDSVLAALGRMRLQMSQIVGQVRQASESIATGSTEIATGNSDL